MIQNRDKHLHISLPGRSNNYTKLFITKVRNLWQVLHILCNSRNAVKSGVPGQTAMLHSYALEQCKRLLVLYKNMIKTKQHSLKKPTPFFEKNLVRAEDGREGNDARFVLFQLSQVIVPEFVFNKKRDFRLNDFHKAPCIGCRIPGQITDVV